MMPNNAESGIMVTDDGIIYANTILYSNQPRHVTPFFLPSYRDTENAKEAETATKRETETETKVVPLTGPDLYIATQVINYSELFNAFTSRDRQRDTDRDREGFCFSSLMCDPAELCSGDIVQTCDYRGVGSYYVVWLHKDAFHNHAMMTPAFAADPEEQDKQKFKEMKDKELKGKRDFAQVNLTSAYDYGLEDDVIRKIQQILSGNKNIYRYNDKREGLREQLAPLLEVVAPVLLDELCAPGNFRALAAVSGIQFADIQVESFDSSNDFAEFDANEDCDGEGNVFGASDMIANLPNSKYPILKRRGELTRTVNSHKQMSCYLFSHNDEMGYSAPTAVSMARVGQLPQQEHYNRDVDLVLLPPPLDQHTMLGRAMNSLRQKMQDAGRFEGEDESSNDEDNEEENEENENKESKNDRDIVIVDVSCEDQISFHSLAGAEDYYSGNGPSIILTRNIFQQHANAIRRDLTDLSHSSTDIEEVLLKYLGF